MFAPAGRLHLMGGSSLSYPGQFPVDVLKIEKSFIDQLVSGEERGRVFVRGIISLAHSLGLRTVAEGIESFGPGKLAAIAGNRG